MDWQVRVFGSASGKFAAWCATQKIRLTSSTADALNRYFRDHGIIFLETLSISFRKLRRSYWRYRRHCRTASRTA